MNRLAQAASAYLTSAAHQPVHWYSWGEEAFEQARAGNRPVLLDIGAVWCHWCHVMDGESYEDPEVAAFLNEHYVCIKVDRDERPDVDARYQRAVQALTGQGGWPLTAFLTPQGEVFYGGTYFPPDDRFGRPGFRTVLARVLEIYTGQREQVEKSARELTQHTGAAMLEHKRGQLSEQLIVSGAEQMARLFDWRHGGFGTAPKFPHPAAVQFLLTRWWDIGAPWPREVAEKTLAGMARGGMYDQIGGGFHRYSVDERWIVPHFEKMASDNAELLRAYVQAYAAWKVPQFAETAEGIVQWAMEVLAHDGGGFGASQDADVGINDDGDYFTWTVDEARQVLSADEFEVASRRWDIGPSGDMHHDPSRNVLWVARSVEAIAAELKVEPSQVEVLIRSAHGKLKAARDARKAPFVDRTLYVNWNAMMAEAFLEASAVLERPDCREFALKTMEKLWTDGFVPGQGMVHRIGPGPRSAAAGPWLLDDQVQAASAFLTAYEHTGQGEWLDRGRELTDMMLAFYWDEHEGGFFDSREQQLGYLGSRAKPIQDAPTNSPNAVAAMVLLRLAVLSGDNAFRVRAQQTLEAFAGSVGQLGLHAATYLRALDMLLNGESKIVVADTTTPVGPLLGTALRTYRARRVVVPSTKSPVPGVLPPVALVCAGTACAAPVTTALELRETLESFGRRR